MVSSIIGLEQYTFLPSYSETSILNTGDIQRLTERYGGRFEDLDIAACTHLVASQRAIDNDFKKGAISTPYLTY